MPPTKPQQPTKGGAGCCGYSRVLDLDAAYPPVGYVACIDTAAALMAVLARSRYGRMWNIASYPKVEKVVDLALVPAR